MDITKTDYTDKSDWTKWLTTLSKFFSCYSVSPIHNSKTNVSRPYVPIKIQSSTIIGLLDTGSSISILGNNSHQKYLDMGFTLHNCKPTPILAAGGQRMTTLGIIQLPVSFQGQCHMLSIHVVPEVSNNMILGMDFWKIFGLFPKYLESIVLQNPNEAHLINATIDNNHLLSYVHLTDSQKSTADNLIAQFKDISYEKIGLGRTSLITHSIDTGDATPIRQRYYRMSPEKQKILCEQLQDMLADDVVEPCESPWSSPVLLTPKKTGDLRFCLDSRKLNAVTKKDAYNLPYISEILDNLRDCKYLSSIDLSKSFWQILIKKEDRCKTAFYIPGRGTFQFKCMAFGLTNAPATQQRLVDFLFYGPEFEHKVFIFIDDIIIIASSFQEHISLLTRVLEKLKQANLTINYEKSQFFKEKLKYLGYIVDSNGLHADPEKVESILNYPSPTNRKEVRRFLGTASWYRRFIPNFSTLAAPLNKLTSQGKKAPPFHWTSEANDAFQKLKDCLVTSPVLSCPDYSQPFQVHTDASDLGIGAVLTQMLEGEEKVIAYMSKSLSAQERNYSATEREALAVLIAIEHWRCYLENGQKFTIYTDHSSLKWFLNLNNPTGRLARWGVRLSAFNFEIKHRRGKDNIVPDFLSRAIPVSAITSTNIGTPASSDAWYLNIYNGCQLSPTSYLNYKVTNNKLYRYMKSLNPLTRDFEWKEVVPSESRQDIMEMNHSDPKAAHLGVYKTYRRIALTYFWPNMLKDVTNLVNNCDACISHKHANHATLGLMGRPKGCSRPFQMISVDLVGPLPVSSKQNTMLLVVTCCFSKYSLLFPIRRATAEVVTRILEEHVFLVHGIPTTVLMDNGKQFISKKLQLLFSQYKIPNIHYTPKYTPQVNLVERYNKTIMTAVSTYIEKDHRKWDVNIPKIQFALNTAVSEVTGYTPSFLVYGRELVTCGSYYLDTDTTDDIIFSPRDPYAENVGKLRSIFDQVQSSLLKAHNRNSGHYNLRRKNVEFNVGDIIWKKTYFKSDKDNKFSKKLAPKYQKCQIKTKLSPLVYVLKDMQGKDLGSWHVKDFKITKYSV